MTSLRIGHGYDVHKLVQNRDLILGGVKIPFDLGLLGHSDADVLTHAVMDALLGAASLGDIGKLFPDNDERFKGISSLLLAKEVASHLRKHKFEIVNLDCTILCQKPKLAPYIPQMKENLANTLSISSECISIKATTEEGLGFTGNLEGIAAHTVCLIEKI